MRANAGMGGHWALGVKGTTVNAVSHETGTHLGLPSLLCKVARECSVTFKLQHNSFLSER